MKTIRELKALQALDNELKTRINVVIGGYIAKHFDKDEAMAKIEEILNEYEDGRDEILEF